MSVFDPNNDEECSAHSLPLDYNFHFRQRMMEFCSSRIIKKFLSFQNVAYIERSFDLISFG